MALLPWGCTAADAVRLANPLLRQGHSLDIGVMQVNSRWLTIDHLPLAKLFDPCFNIAVGTRILAASYRGYHHQSGDAAAALTQALSTYNTGSPTAGRAYVTRVVAAARHVDWINIASRAPHATLSFTDSAALFFSP